MKRILVPIDFSEHALNALKYGIEIANRLNADLRIVHIKTKKRTQKKYFYKSVEALITESIDDWIDDIVSNCKKDYHVPGGNIDFKIREGNVFKEISNQAKYDDTTLMVIGTHGASGFEDKYMGSNAYRLVNASPVPVLTIRPESVWSEVEKIVLPIGLSKASRQKVPPALGMAKLFDAKVYVVGIKESGYSILNSRVKGFVRQIVKYIEKNTDLEVESTVLTGGKRVSALLDYSNQLNADIMVAGIHHSGNLFESKVKSFANQVINESQCPVLAVPTKEMLSLMSNY